MLQHQIVQSPARLGLTNPTSPSIQTSTPTPPKFPTPQPSQQSQPPSSHHHPSATTTSSALLSLLPPLRRAQSLLLQMASLSTKLFELSPNKSHWLSAFRGSLPTFLPNQSQSLPPPSSTDPAPSSTKEILSLFTSLQTQLFESVAELQEILDLQDAKQRVSREIKAKDSSLLNFANKLKEAERVLDILVDDYADYRRPKRAKNDGNEEHENDDVSSTTVASQLKLSDILSYGHRISYTTFAPPEFGAGQAPLRGALPPAPQEEKMRASQLYAFADLDVGLPKIVETKEKTIEAIIEPPPPPPPPPQAEAKPLENLPAFQGLLPPNFTIPPGWKPGDPVVWPADLPVPPPPPGWKPGDPVPLESIHLPREQQLQPVAPQGLHKPPEPIQVRPVNLDIPEHDDDSSDYSSDVESSDDED